MNPNAKELEATDLPSEQHVAGFRFVGRGGQGVVTAAELLARTAAYEGRIVQAIPYFGAERRGSMVTASARVSDQKIWTREPVTAPDVVVILDDSLLKESNVFDGMRRDSCLILNTTMSLIEVATQLKAMRKEVANLSSEAELWIVDATGIAMRFLKKPIVNTLMLGAILRARNLISLDSIKRAVAYRFPNEDIAANMSAIEEVSRNSSLGHLE